MGLNVRMPVAHTSATTAIALSHASWKDSESAVLNARMCVMVMPRAHGFASVWLQVANVATYAYARMRAWQDVLSMGRAGPFWDVGSSWGLFWHVSLPGCMHFWVVFGSNHINRTMHQRQHIWLSRRTSCSDSFITLWFGVGWRLKINVHLNKGCDNQRLPALSGHILVTGRAGGV